MPLASIGAEPERQRQPDFCPGNRDISGLREGIRWGINITAYCGRTIENIIVVGAVGGPSHGARGSPVGRPAARVSRVPRARGDFFALSFTRRARCDRLRPAMVAPDRLSPATVSAHRLAR